MNKSLFQAINYNHWAETIAPDEVREGYLKLQRRNRKIIEQYGYNGCEVRVKTEDITDELLKADDRNVYIVYEFEEYLKKNGFYQTRGWSADFKKI